jgi:hypothetical protein
VPLLLGAVAMLPGAGRGEELEHDAVYLPAPAANVLDVRNPLGTVRLRAWDQPQVRIVAEKHAQAAPLLERLKVRVDLVNGRYRITTGFYLADETFSPLPLTGGGIDLTIDAPRGVALAAATFTGDIEASGFRAGARLSSQEGRIRVADMEGRIDTRTLDGSQWFREIRGSLAASGVTGDVELASIEGDSVDASVYKGQIVAREVHAAVVRLRTTVGTIVLVGALRPDARYDLATHDGDVRLVLRPAPFRVIARAPTVRSGFPLAEAQASLLAPDGQTALRVGDYAGGGASLELVSARGAVDLRPAE